MAAAEPAAQTASAAAAAAARRDVHVALSSPALLSHIFKFAARQHKDVKLLHVCSAWEDTAVNYCPFMWCRLAADAQVAGAPPMAGELSSIEQWSQHCFSHYVRTAWMYSAFTPSIFARLNSNLRELKLPSCRELSDAGLQQLARCLPHLQSLNLGWCSRIADAGLRHLSNLQSLETLSLRGCNKITDAGLQHLTSLQQMQSLDLSSCEQITDAGLQAHVSKMQSLRSLRLCDMKNITDAGVGALAALEQLEELQLESCTLTDAVMPRLPRSLRSLDISRIAALSDAALRSLPPQLTFLNIAWLKLITDDGIAALQTPALQHLIAANCDRLTDVSLAHLSKLGAQVSYAYVNVFGCKQISSAAKAAFRQAHPNCELVG